ncbi:MAG: methylmalonyl Co-A mutase-associated GTPase MeaB [Planctomycetota bacterium]
MTRARRPDLAELERGVRAGDRGLLARAITLVESVRAEDREAAQTLVNALLDRTGGAYRVGLSGPPGVGKSSFIETLGCVLCDRGHRVAVLAVDPSSSLTGGSILGDKSRMVELSRRDEAFIRPSPSAATLGGVARRTREALLLCEAAGHDVVLVETVGVGQSETAVADMVDTFCVLAQPGAGDELQGIKRGILELADVVAVNKADGSLLPAARIAVAELQAAFHYARPRGGGWAPRALAVSAHERSGIDEFWEAVEAHRAAIAATGELESRRVEQRRRWLWDEIRELTLRRIEADETVRERFVALEDEVAAGRRTPGAAAAELVAALFPPRGD